MIKKDTCTPVFIEALFPTGKTWMQLKSPVTEEWIKKMWYIYSMEYYSAIKKNETMSFAATCMNLEMFILSEVSQTEMEKYRMTSYMRNPKGNDTNELIIQKVSHRLRE